MTKFDRAKKQTLKKWEAVLWSWVDRELCQKLACGFCQQYGYVAKVDKQHKNIGSQECAGCPVFAIEGQEINCGWTILKWQSNSREIIQRGFRAGILTDREIDCQIPLVLAVLMYVESMEV